HRSSVGDLRPLDGHRVRSTKNNLTQPPRIPALAEDAVIKRSRALSLRLCVLLAAVSRPAPRRYLRADTPVKGPTRASLIGPEHSWAEVPPPTHSSAAPGPILASSLVPSRTTAVEASLSRGRRHTGHAHFQDDNGCACPAELTPTPLPQRAGHPPRSEER